MKKYRTGTLARLAHIEKGIHVQCLFKCPAGHMACPAGVLLRFYSSLFKNVYRGR